MRDKNRHLDGRAMVFPRFVAFFGPDGAGKSTHVRLLVTSITSSGFEVKKAWIRSVHTFAYLLWILLSKLNLCPDKSGMPVRSGTGLGVSYLHEDPYGAVSPLTMSPPVLKGPVSKFIWSTIELASIVPVVILQIYLPLMLGRVVVAERFVVDSIATIAYFLDDENFAGKWQARFLLRLVPKGTVFVYVDADYETVLLRRGDSAGPREYTDFHRRLYSELAHKVGAFYVNTSKNSIEEVNEKILKFLLQRNLS